MASGALSRRNLFKLAGAGAAACALPAVPTVTLAAPATPSSLALAILLCNDLKRALNDHVAGAVVASVREPWTGGTYTLAMPAPTSEPAHQS